MTRIPSETLNNGVRIPQLGLGTAELDDAGVQPVVRDALDLGYRLVDTAAKYENEAGVGAALAGSGVPRGELFVSSKLRGADQGYGEALRGFDASLARLGLEYLDLYLIHWPLPRLDAYVDSWRAMERLYAERRVRAIGVSNFLPEHLDRLLAETDVVPAVNQIEVHPWLPQAEQRAHDARRGIHTQGYSPLGAGELLTEPVLVEIAERHDTSPAQVVLRWHLQLGIITFPKASSRERLAQNVDVFGFTLTDAEVDRISGLANGTRVRGQDPATHEEL